jgi:PAS domain S-box-containing protein
MSSSGVYMFDWRALKRWELSERNLPPGSIVLYRESTLWEKHSRLVIATVLTIFLMALLSAYLLLERRRRGVAERELEEEMKFQRLISELSTFFIDLRPDQVDVGIDSALHRVLGALALDRISVLEFVENGSALRFTHVSDRQNGPQVGTLVPCSDLPYLTTQLADNKTVIVSSFDRCFDMSTNERELMRSRGAQAGVFVPLEARGSVLGALAFISGLERRWSEKVATECTMLGQVFASALIRKKEDEALLTSELLKNAILSSLSGDVAVIDHNGRIVGTNAWSERNEDHRGMFSEEESVQGGNILDIYQRSTHMTDPLGTPVASGIRAVLEGQLPHFEVEWSQESAGGKRWFITSVTPIHPWERERGAVVTRTEITARKQAEEERLELSGRLIDLQEKERSRLARELHDDFNQRLAVLAIDLERTAQTVTTSPLKASQKLHELWSQATEIGTDLHSLSHRLHSSTLEGLGLVLGLSSLCEEFAAQHEIQVDFMHDRVPRFIPPDIALCLFRIAQEALRNVKRHSGASRAEVRLEGKGDVISLSISDEGIGFALSRVSTGLGVRSMHERLRLLNGRFEIRSQPGVGTVIQVTVPLPPKEYTSEHKEPDRITRRDVYATD